jgi:hypothetical protein
MRGAGRGAVRIEVLLFDDDIRSLRATTAKNAQNSDPTTAMALVKRLAT